MSDPTRPLALITGAATGIGAACAEELHRSGFQTLLHYRSHEMEARTLSQALGGAPLFRADLETETGVDALFQWAKAQGPLEVLVNNAGQSLSRPLFLTSLEQMEKLTRLNQTSVWYLSKRVAGAMLRQGHGHIVNISSVVGSSGNAMQSAYAMTKAAVDNLTKSLAQELGPRGIRVNAVAPGLIDTDMTAHLPEEVTQHILGMVPIGRKGTPQEVARVVRFLVTEGSYCNGAVIAVNGGLHCG